MHGLAISSFLGIYALAWFTNLPDKRWCFLMVAFSILILGLLRLLPLGRKYLLYTICIFLSFSYACWTANTIAQAQLPQVFEGKNLQVVGLVQDLPEASKTGYNFLLQVEKVLAVDGQPDPVIAFAGRVRLAWYSQPNEALPELQAGERWQFVIRAKRPHGLSNPSGFDYERWLFAERILATGYVREKEDAIRLAPPARFSVNSIREYINRAIAKALGEQASTGLVQGLAVAATAGISQKQWQVLKATGTAHLLSISGLHIAMVASLGWLAMSLVWWLLPALYLYLPVRLAGGIVGAGLATAYALLAGFNIPTQRSLVMVLILMLGLLLRQRLSFSVSFAWAVLVVLMLDPLAPLTLGFWLSFGSVALLALLSQHQAHSKGVRLFSLQLSLSMFLIPLNIAFFSSLPVYSPLANLVAIPWVTLVVVPLILLGILVLPLSFEGASGLWQLAAKALDGLEWGLTYLAELPNALLYFPELPWYWLVLAMLGMLLILLPRGIPGRWLGLICLLPLLTWQPSKPALGEFRLTVLDVGQGLATVIQTAEHSLVFDTGSKSPYGFDMGEVVLTPWLRSQQLSSLDMLMVSHGDNDHRGGADYLLEHFSVQQLVTNDQANFPESARQAWSVNTPLTTCAAGQTWVWDEVKFEVLNPLPKIKHSKENNQACVLRVSNGGHALLLPADIEQAAEQALLAQGSKLQADVVLVPHHGSKTSSSIKFLQALTPKLAIVSSGYLNRFHHPHPKIVERYQAQGIELLNTAATGAIEVNFPRLAQQALIISSYREQQAGFWKSWEGH
ncbi:DNA internalization-related competence protein ComEC/Rec2 [Thiothrix eikelboomii]|uniref:DNA internalization-related competence protein ComEC/Rec2 n=1 Tax=Thiothrix eikelboomii TaxID=92487 RepID=UPI003BB004E8